MVLVNSEFLMVRPLMDPPVCVQMLLATTENLELRMLTRLQDKEQLNNFVTKVAVLVVHWSRVKSRSRVAVIMSFKKHKTKEQLVMSLLVVMVVKRDALESRLAMEVPEIPIKVVL